MEMEMYMGVQMLMPVTINPDANIFDNSCHYGNPGNRRLREFSGLSS